MLPAVPEEAGDEPPAARDDAPLGKRPRSRPGGCAFRRPSSMVSAGSERARLARSLESIARQHRRLERLLFVLMLLVLAAATLAQTVPGGVPAARGINPGPAAGTAAGPAADTLILPATDAAIASRPDDSKQEPVASSVQFIGTATVLIRHAGFTILTDPNFLHKGERAPLGYGLSSERLTEPAIDLDHLPPIDLVVLSHLHGDHFDPTVERRLDRRIPIVTTPDAAAYLASIGFTATRPLGTWQSLTVRKGDASLHIAAMPARHGPVAAALLMPQTMGAIIDFARGDALPEYRIYISGDTLVFDEIEEIPRRFPAVDLALLHLGGTRILGFLKVTMDGKDGVEMLRIVAPKRAIPIHFNDYTVFRSPLSDFEKEVDAAGWHDRVTYLKHGESFPLPLPPSPAR